MSSHTLYVREAAACQRAAEQTRDPVLAKQLWRDQTMWLGLARLSAAVEGLALAIGPGGPDDALATGGLSRRRSAPRLAPGDAAQALMEPWPESRTSRRQSSPSTCTKVRWSPPSK